MSSLVLKGTKEVRRDPVLAHDESVCALGETLTEEAQLASGAWVGGLIV